MLSFANRIAAILLAVYYLLNISYHRMLAKVNLSGERIGSVVLSGSKYDLASVELRTIQWNEWTRKDGDKIFFQRAKERHYSADISK